MSSARHTWWRRAAARVVPLALTVGGPLGLQAATPAYAADPVDGAQTAGDAMFPTVGNGGYDALHYDVDLAWDATGVVSGSMTGGLSSASTTMVATTTGDPLRTFSLDFEGLSIDAVTVDGVPAAYARVQDADAIRFKLIVTPATPVDGEFTTAVTYHGTPSVHVDPDGSWEGWAPTADGAILLGQPVGSMAGYPNNNTPGDKATYTFSIDVPSTITSASGTGPSAAVSNGELAARTLSPDGSRTTWEWVQRNQMASELALVSIGKYDVIEAQVTLAGGRTIPEWSFMDSALSQAAKTTITDRRARLGAIIDKLELLYGPYPGTSTGVVIDTVPSGVDYALETQDRSFFPSAGSVNGNTLIHELAHQWYGDSVSPGLWTDIWINEGMATWGPTYYTSVLNATTPNPAAVESTYFTSWSSTAPTSAAWTTPPGAQTDPSDLYGYQTYTRGAQFWEALRTVLRDQDFLAVVEQWQSRYAGQSPRGDRLKELAEEISGHDLDAFWQDWILDADKPAWPARYDVSLAATPAQGTLSGGTAATYTIRAANTGKVALTDGVVSVDVAALSDDGAIGALPAGVTRTGDTLTWVVPPTAVGATATTSFPFTVSGSASTVRETVFATAAPVSLGGACVSCGALETAPAPVVTGTPRVGVALTAATDGWSAGTTFAYQWSVAGAAVAGATTPAYTPVAGDLTRTVTVAVTGTAPGHAPTRRVSPASAAVTDNPVPTLSGPPQAGVPVTAVPGTWGEGVTLGYRWTVAGVDVGTAPSYTPVGSDVGRVLTVAVTGTGPGYATVTRTSEPALVRAGTLAATPVPGVSGAARFGSTLVAAPGAWDDGVTLSFQWLRAGTPVAGATASSYSLRRADLGAPIAVAVTGTRPGYGSVTTTSAATADVARATMAPGRVTVAGKAVVGRVLRGRVTGFGRGVEVSYTWYAGSTRIGRGPRIRLSPGTAGRRITVEVRVRKAGHAPARSTSRPTAKVRDMR